MTEFKGIGLEASDVDGCKGEDGNDADLHEEEDTLQADDGSLHNVED